MESWQRGESGCRVSSELLIAAVLERGRGLEADDDRDHRWDNMALNGLNSFINSVMEGRLGN